MNTVQLDIFGSRQARDAGIETAITHADQVQLGWSEEAYKLLKEFLLTVQAPFMAEEVRSYAAEIDFPLPPHARAWGGVIARAAKAGIIKQCGTGKVKNVKAHRANAAIWRKAT